MIMKPSDPLIHAIKKYQAGDQSAFDTIYYESFKYVTKSVLNVLNRVDPNASEDLQQDIIQDTYLTIASKLDTLQNPEAFLQWAGQIATHNAQRTWNKDIRQKQMEQSEDEMVYELVDEDFIPEDILFNKEKQRMIRKILEELPTNQYLCVVEYFYNGLKETEVAEKLGMPVNTVKTNLSRAKKKLREVIESKQKKSGVKLYSISGLLLLLLMQEVSAMASEPAKEAAILSGIHAEMAGATGAATAAGATGAAVAKASATATVFTKIGAGVLAAAITVGGAVGGTQLVRNRLSDSASSETTQPSISASVTTATTRPTETTKPIETTTTVPVTTQPEITVSIPEDAFVYNGHSYYLFVMEGSWEETVAYCESLGGYMATISDPEENEALYEYMHACGHESAYFGLYQDYDDQWRWVNGEPVEYTNWHSGEPSGGGGVERYAMFYDSFPGSTWNDGSFGYISIDDAPAVLCEWEANSGENSESQSPVTPNFYFVVYATVFDTTLVLSAEPVTEYEGISASSDSDLFVGIDHMGDIGSSITKVVILDELSPKSTRRWFGGMRNLESIEGLEKLNTEHVTDMSEMFADCFWLRTVEGLRDWDVGNVTNMNGMFTRCSLLTQVDDLSGWDTKNVEDMGGMFSSCRQLQSIGDISNWDVGKVREMGMMFALCANLSGLGDLNGWNIDENTDIWNMFYSCGALGELPQWYTG